MRWLSIWPSLNVRGPDSNQGIQRHLKYMAHNKLEVNVRSGFNDAGGFCVIPGILTPGVEYHLY